jgi:hypothetical protein
MLRRLALPLTAALCLALPAAAQAKQVTLAPANNTGETLYLDQDRGTLYVGTGQSDVYPTETGLTGGALADGVRAQLAFATDGCGTLCGLSGSVTFLSADSEISYVILFADPMFGPNSANCLGSGVYHCDISFNPTGKDLEVNTNLYAVGYGAAPKPTVTVATHSLHDAGQVLRAGVPLQLQASRAGQMVTRLVPVGADPASASASAVHGRLRTRVVTGGFRFERRLRLNRAGRRVVRRLGVARYRLVTVFTAEDGVRTRRSRRITIARP